MAHSPKAGAVVFAKDVGRTARFYALVTGLEVKVTAGDHVVLGSGSFELVVHGIPAVISESITITDPPELREETPIKLIFPVASIAAARELAPTLGGAVFFEARQWSIGSWLVCDGFDPEGNVIQLRQDLTT
jgi:predicted enzyme related to lactoylglutathione lyase